MEPRRHYPVEDADSSIVHDETGSRGGRYARAARFAVLVIVVGMLLLLAYSMLSEDSGEMQGTGSTPLEPGIKSSHSSLTRRTMESGKVHQVRYDAVSENFVDNKTGTPLNASGLPSAVMLYRNGCGHCTRASPSWDQLAGEMRGRVFAKMHINQDTSKAFKIRGVPAFVRLSPEGALEKMEEGYGTISKLREFFTENSAPL
jgi:thiol-disulfide isomerase/thioredoxin